MSLLSRIRNSSPVKKDLASNGLRDDANLFIESLQIKPSTTSFMSISDIYWVYAKWMRQRRRGRMSRIRFFDGWNKQFPQRIVKIKGKTVRQYGVESEYLQISQEEENIPRWLIEKEKQSQKKQKQQKQKRLQEKLKKQQDALQILLGVLKPDTSQE